MDELNISVITKYIYMFVYIYMCVCVCVCVSHKKCTLHLWGTNLNATDTIHCFQDKFLSF